MGGRRKTVQALAREAGLDLDETLVRLWDAGFTHLEDPSDALADAQLRRAQRALDVATDRDIRVAGYWKTALGLSDIEFRELLKALDIRMSLTARKVPRGAVAKLKRAAAARLGTLPASPRSDATETRAKVSVPPLEWETVGHPRGEIRFLEPDEVVAIHNFLVAEFANDRDPIAPPGVADSDLLASACFRPHTAMGSDQKYPTVEMAAAALLHSLVLNHAFFNGNKRTGLVSLLVFLDENHLQLTCSEDDLFRLVLLLAQHALVQREVDSRSDREVMKIAEWLRENSRRIETGERIIKWVRLKRILGRLGCWTEMPSKGNRINVCRNVNVPRRGMFSKRTEKKRLRVQVHYTGDGADVSRSTIAHLRRELRLDDEHGIDSQRFYEMELPVQDFIIAYRKTLKRLAKL